MRILHIKNTKRIRKRKNFLIFQNRDLEIPRMEILGDDLRVGGGVPHPCEDRFLESVRRDANGRYIVHIPLTDDIFLIMICLLK